MFGSDDEIEEPNRSEESEINELRAELAALKAEIAASASAGGSVCSSQVGGVPAAFRLPPVDPDDFALWDVQRLEDEVAVTAAVINAHQGRLAQIASLLPQRTDLWGDETLRRGRWLSWKTGFTRAETSRLCRVGDRMTQCPQLATEHLEGRIGQDLMATLTSICTPDNEAALIESTHIAPPDRIKRIATHLRRTHRDHHPDLLPKTPEDTDRLDDQTQTAYERNSKAPSTLSWFWDHDNGRLDLRGELNLADGLMFTKACDVEAERARVDDPEFWKSLLFGEQRAHSLTRLVSGGMTNTTTPTTDRYKIILHANIATPQPPQPPATPDASGTAEPGPSGATDAPTASPPPPCPTPPHPPSTSPLVSDAPLVAGFPAPTGGGWAEHGGPPVSDEFLADLLFQQNQPFQVLYYTDPKVPLQLGRTHRFASTHQRRVIHAQQHGICAWPTCDRPIRDIHHITEWNQGGTTDLDNLVGLCATDHRNLDHGATLTRDTDGTLTAIDRHGTNHTPPTTTPPTRHPDRLVAAHAQHLQPAGPPNQGYEGRWDTYALESIYLLWHQTHQTRTVSSNQARSRC